MTKLVLVFGLLAVFACKKDGLDLNDKTVYQWERSLMRRIFDPLNTPVWFDDTANRPEPPDEEYIFVETDLVFVTNEEVKEQERRIKKASKYMFKYEFKKL